MVGVGEGFLVGVGMGVSVMTMMSRVGGTTISVGVTVTFSILELFLFPANKRKIRVITMINNIYLDFIERDYIVNIRYFFNY